MKRIKLSSVEEELLIEILQRHKENSELLGDIHIPQYSEMSPKEIKNGIKQQKKMCDHFIKKVTGEGKRELNVE